MRREEFLPRLAFIKYLYDLAVEQSRRPFPLAYASVLMFHDSVELFLVLACEHHNAQIDKRTDFDKYFVKLADPPANMSVVGKAAMIRLNDARVSLKHRGMFTDPKFVEEARASVSAFFDDNTPPLLDTEFGAISLVDLVEYKETRESLREASALTVQGDLGGAITKIAIAFHQLVRDYENSKRGRHLRSPFRFGDPLTSESAFFLHIQDKGLARFVDKARESIQALQGAVRILSLGLDYRRYTRFQTLTPLVWLTSEGIVTDSPPERVTLDGCQFCFNFVIEAAIRLQDFDYALEDPFTQSLPHMDGSEKDGQS